MPPPLHDRHSLASQAFVVLILIPVSAILLLPLVAAIILIGRWIIPSAENLFQAIALLLWGTGAIALAGSLGDRIRLRLNRDSATQRNATAKHIYTQLSGGPRPPSYILFLRSFASDRVYQNWYDHYSISNELHATSFDDELALALEKSGLPLLAIGDRKDDRIGAGTISTADEDWEEVAVRLMMGARAIVIVPSITQGIAKEVMRISSEGQLSQKSVFVMLPRISEEHWNAVKDYFLPQGILLPSHYRFGAFFSLHNSPIHCPPSFTENSDILELVRRSLPLPNLI